MPDTKRWRRSQWVAGIRAIRRELESCGDERQELKDAARSLEEAEEFIKLIPDDFGGLDLCDCGQPKAAGWPTCLMCANLNIRY